MNCLSVYDHFVGLALKGLTDSVEKKYSEQQDFENGCVERTKDKYLLIFNTLMSGGKKEIKNA